MKGCLKSVVARLGLATLLALLPAGCGSSDQPVDERYITLEGQGFEVRFDLERGRFDVTLEDGHTVLQNAVAEVEVGTPGELEPLVFRSSDDFVRSGTSEPAGDALGIGQQARIELKQLAGAPDLTLYLNVYDDEPFMTATVEAHNNSDAAIRLARLVPAKIEAQRHGALFVGNDPHNMRILEDGSFFLFEFFVDILPGDVELGAQTDALAYIHGYQKGHSISNWNHAIYDLDSGKAFVAGSLDFDHASPMCNTSYDADLARPVGGRTPFTYWSVEFPYMPSGKPLEAGRQITAGPVFIIPGTHEPLAGLERYAKAVKQWNDIRLWTERNSNNRVPTGWNSWTGSGSSGGYGADINQQLMLDNLDAMATQFKDFGGEWFQIDDGYEYNYGDWDWRPDRFPDGSAYMADQIMADGLIPGIWIAPFQVSENSQTYAEHEADGWFAPTIPLAGGDKPVLDLTNPDVQSWLTARFRKIRADGYRWIKTDFVYWALGASSFYDSGATREEAYRQGLAAIKAGSEEGAADAGGQIGDTFWLSVSMIGPHLGFVDSIRPNLDTMPAWEAEDPSQGRISAQGIKPTVRTMVRRFYLQDRALLFNHDMLFFRADAMPDVPPLTSDESHAELSAMAMSGSVAKLGEKLVDMLPEWINDYRTVIPVYGHAARPIDLFEREFPEVWHMHVIPSEGLNTGGSGPAYDVIALFNWGTNRDLTVNPYLDMPDQARNVSADLESLGIDPDQHYVARDFWSGDVIEIDDGQLERTVQPHTVQMFALRKIDNRPQYIGGNRHVLQGAVEIKSINWDAGAATLSISYDAAPGSVKAPFSHKLYFRLPDGWSLAQAGVSGATDGSVQTSSLDGRLLELRFTVDTHRDVAIAIGFNQS